MIGGFGIDALRRRAVLFVLLGVAVAFGLTLYANAADLGRALAHFRWGYVPLILGLTTVNYALRFVKWDFYVGIVDCKVSRGDSLAIFLAGLSMAITPGKVGEMLKPLLLRLRWNTPIAASTPIVVAERATDGAALVLLALTGVLLWDGAWVLLLATSIAGVALLLLIGTKRGQGAVESLARRIPWLRDRHLEGITAFLHSSRRLFTPARLLFAVLLGVVSWGAEGIAFSLVLNGLGQAWSLSLLEDAIFVLAASTLVGSITLLPGGLGSADASVAGLLVAIVHLGRAPAAAATLLIRFCTLWYGVAIGLVALWLLRDRLASPAIAVQMEDSPQPDRVPATRSDT